MYPDGISVEEINRVMDLHCPLDETVGRKMDSIRALYKTLAFSVFPLLDDTEERKLAWTSLRTSLMFAIAALACNQDTVSEDQA